MLLRYDESKRRRRFRCIDDLGITTREYLVIEFRLQVQYNYFTTSSTTKYLSYQKSDIVSAVLVLLILLEAFSISESLQIHG